MKVLCNKTNPPLGGLLAVEFYRSSAKNVDIVWGNESSVTLLNSPKPVPYGTSNDLIRILENNFNKSVGPLEKVTMNHWLSLSLILIEEMPKSLEYLDKTLGPITYLHGEALSVSDLAVFSALYASNKFQELSKTKTYNNITRWMKLIQAQEPVIKALKSIPADVLENLSKISSRSTPENKETGMRQEGKFVELPHAEMGKVVVRFPPEASGYLHIGHAKAALLNQYYQEAFEGKLVMRFDDTNPAKENAEFEKVILEDVEMLEIKPDMFTHTSQYFDLMLQFCEKLIKEGKAFVDDTPAEQMKNEREQRIDSRNKSNSVEKNLQLWEEMKKGSDIGVQNCVRAIIDMQSANGCLRDPTIYRCKPEPHPRTGTQYKVYPTYDFACPIVDSIEGVTHVLRTMEYHDRDPQFYWFIDALGLRKPYIWEYSRLSMTNTVLSKRKLTWFVEQGLVDGWDDPRMPTVRGVLRRGLTVEALRRFIRAQGSSRSVVFMEWDKIWAINKKVIDPVAPRFTALESKPVPVNLKGVTSDSTLDVPLHPKNPDVGNKKVWISKTLLIDQVDAKTLKEGENATFINYGNIMIDKIHKAADGTVTRIDATPNLDNKDYKKTLKLTWIAETPQSPMVETYCVYFDHIISKPLLGKDEDFKKYIGHQTRWEVPMLGEMALESVKEGDIIQLQRRGFFRVDAAGGRSALTGQVHPLVLLHVPDGRAETQTKPIQAIAKEPVSSPSSGDAENLNIEITKQGDVVRSLKTSKAEKAKIDEAVKTLLDLKAKYKEATGQDWKPGASPAKANSSPSSDVSALNSEITKQGDLVRSLKASKAEKGKVDEAVKALLELKAKYKAATGQDWKPDAAPVQTSPVSDASSLNSEIIKQGDIVRSLKSAKAEKAKVDEAVKVLLDLKNKYKAATGQDWKPGKTPFVTPLSNLNSEIIKQGDLVRSLKSAKAEKAKVDEAVKVLLELKNKYKAATGQDWKPEGTQASSNNSSAMASNEASSLNSEIIKQGDLVRSLKSAKAEKAKVDEAVKVLLDLKNKYKAATGQDWKPTQEVKVDDSKVTDILNEITSQGDKVRTLKTEKADKSVIDAEVKNLLNLKAQYKNLTGSEWTANAAAKQDNKKSEKKADSQASAGKANKADKKEKKPKENKPKEQVKPKEESGSGVKKVTRLGMEANKETDLPEWYSQVITKSEMIDYYDISGCYILRPWSFSIWEGIRSFLSAQFKKMGVKDGYFPIFVSKAALEREKTHISDFAPEVAWVTHSGSSELAEHVAVRPTSETVMYPAYAKWIQSHRDLPLRINQWNNVVRWEFKQPQPFLRTREFLWQEGHTAFRTKEEADKEVLHVLDLYAQVYEDLLAIPVVKGRKTEKEKFAGADYTTTVEAYIPASGRGIQGATSHHLGQNFSKMFEIVYDDPDTQEKKFVYQNSWGLTTRTIGVMVLVHGDDRGLVLPPRIASIQVIVVPCGITASSTDEERKSLIDACKQLAEELSASGIRAEGDYRDNYSPGWKFNHWELKGVPIRAELGPKDLSRGEVVCVSRVSSSRSTLKRDGAPAAIADMLEQIHKDMLAKATKERDERFSMVTEWNDFTEALERKHLLYAPFCGDIPCEDNIKTDSARTEDDPTTEVKGPAMGAKSLCIPFSQPRPLKPEDKCIHPLCNNKPQYITLFGRSY
ncbi:bifunctional glutamate/proline--tRNA ligase isoform X2 [Danaus plexippus]|uniref:bifunctional glutamate/proline--tRNA ligase isoform X2 n=1 Tax=Danaus plexippus TaxID=13037 RepID=UPI002AB1686B|nr:bifunctional glutamate/proline--tRNA ligase isoform X2 [Danaus plexippus]